MTQIIPAGKCHATLYSIIDCWTQEINSKTYGKSEKRRVFITWELPEFLHEFKEWDGEKPCVVSQEYTFSTYGSSHMRRMIEAMLGKQNEMTDEEASEVSLDDLVWMRCQIKVIHNAPYVNIGTIYDLDAKEQKDAKKKFKQVNESKLFDLDEFDVKVFDTLPNFLQEKIMKSPEYAEALEKKIVDEDVDNDLPF